MENEDLMTKEELMKVLDKYSSLISNTYISDLTKQLLGDEDLIEYKDLKTFQDFSVKKPKDAINVLTQGYSFTSNDAQAIGFKVNIEADGKDKMLLLKLPRFTFSNGLEINSLMDLKALCKNVVVLTIEEVQTHYTYYSDAPIREDISLLCLKFVNSEYDLNIFLNGKRIK